MGPILRIYLGFAGIGAGLIHMALAAGSPLPEGIVFTALGITEFGWGTITFARQRVLAPRVTRAVAIAPIMLWALVIVLSTVFDAPQLAASLTLLPMAIATVFEIFAAAVLSRYLRPVDPDVLGYSAPTDAVASVSIPATGASADAGTAPRPTGSSTAVATTAGATAHGSATAVLTEPETPAPAVGSEPPAGRYLLALFAGALVLGALVTPALAATESGRYAQEHGMHMGDMGGTSPAPASDPVTELDVDSHDGH